MYFSRKGSLQPDQQQPSASITRQDLDNFKREILQEVRTMIQQFKIDIIDGIISNICPNHIVIDL